MPSGKYLNTDWRVVVNNVELSDHAFDVQIADEKEKVDVSGFGGNKEFLPGQREAAVTVQFLNDFGTATPGSVFWTLQPLYDSGTSFPFYVQPFNDGGTAGSVDPKYGGTANIFSLPAGASLNERGELTAEFSPAPNSDFSWGTAAIGTV
jgi:hypothetical protein